MSTSGSSTGVVSVLDPLLAIVLTKVYLFLMRACFSGACFVQGHVRETQQAFLEARVAAFDSYGGCFGLVRSLGSPAEAAIVAGSSTSTSAPHTTGATKRSLDH